MDNVEEMLKDLERKINETNAMIVALYGWAQELGNGIKAAQNQSGMIGGMIRSMLPMNVPNLDELHTMVPMGPADGR